MKKYARLVLVFIVVLHTAVFISGCAMIDHPPARKAWFSTEKAPMKLIYISDSDKMNPIIMNYMITTTAKQPYHDYKFGSTTTTVSIASKGIQSDIESDTDSMSRKIDVKARVR